MGRGRECELPERNDSRKHSRKYPRELWEVTSLSNSLGQYLLLPPVLAFSIFLGKFLERDKLICAVQRKGRGQGRGGVI